MAGDLPVAIVGAGFSGTLLAVNLLRQGERVVLIERDHVKLAKGLAFGTRRPEHLLNVRAANMSAFPDDPEHFVRWMGFSSAEQVNRFVPRLAYGQYLLEQLIDALAAAGGRGAVQKGEVVAARFEGSRVTLALANGTKIECRAVVLALGNFAPPVPLALQALPPHLLTVDPWEPKAIGGLERSEHIVLVGSGLTAVDVLLSLDRAGFTGRVTALSRRGLRPRSHAEWGPVVGPVSRPQAKGAKLIRTIRERAAASDWRSAIDELRPHIQHLWRTHSPAQQASFLRHARPYWDVHRHRLAPAAAARVDELEQEGRVRFVGGEIVGAAADDAQVEVTVRPRGGEDTQALRVDRVIICTGSEGDLLRVPDPLVRDLLAQGRIAPDVHRLGLDVDHLARVRDAAGKPQDNLFAVGPPTKGEAWEIVAVPDIRRQVWDLARLLADAHWVADGL